MHRVRKLKQHRGEQPGSVVRAHRIRHDDRVDPWKLIGAPGCLATLTSEHVDRVRLATRHLRIAPHPSRYDSF
jgi:hypothetical protein